VSNFDDKQGVKKTLEAYGIRTPKTHGFLREVSGFAEFWKCQEQLKEFVFKPNALSAGMHVHVVKKRRGEYLELDGATHDSSYYEDEAFEILMNNPRTTPGVMMEETIHTHKKITDLYGVRTGIADIRLFVVNDLVRLGWMRTPCKASGYMSNWCKGAVTYFISTDGKIIDGTELMTDYRSKHPDTDKNPTGKSLPFWKQIMRTAEKVALAFTEPFHTIDLTVNEDGDVVVIEGEEHPDLKMMTRETLKILGRCN